MEPRIQYAQTEDGVSIAYWTLGEGMPLVFAPTPPFSHIQREWQWPDYRAFYEALSRVRKLVRYDGRGSGVSEREVTDFSLEAHVRDLEAVVNRLGFDRFALLAGAMAGPAAIAYAALHPERVSHLLLWAAYARASDFYSLPRMKVIRKLRDEDWETYTETVGHVGTGWSEPEYARRYAALIRESVTQEALQGITGEIERFDVSDMLRKVESPTLIMHPGRAPYPPVDLARGLASGIPDARLVVLEDALLLPWVGNTEAATRAIDEFLGESEEAEAGAEGLRADIVHTILFTDMEGSTSLTQQLGDAKAQEVLRTHNTMIRDALRAHDGSETKHTGDGFMASFSSASRALECALDIQRTLARHNESAEEPIRVRIGLNAGEPVADEKDLFGTAVQLAARICAHAEPGQILLPEGVRHLVAGKVFLFADIGDIALRGFEDPVRLFELRWQGED
jgi:class 3 adenylate cyclase